MEASSKPFPAGNSSGALIIRPWAPTCPADRWRHRNPDNEARMPGRLEGVQSPHPFAGLSLVPTAMDSETNALSNLGRKSASGGERPHRPYIDSKIQYG